MNFGDNRLHSKFVHKGLQRYYGFRKQIKSFTVTLFAVEIFKNIKNFFEYHGTA